MYISFINNDNFSKLTWLHRIKGYLTNISNNRRISSFFFIFFFVSFCLLGEFSFGAKLVKENAHMSEKISKNSIENLSSSALRIRKYKRIGFGLTAAGINGLVGANIELNLSPKYSFMVSYGLGNIYQTFSFQVKKFLNGKSLLPFISAGYSRWYNSSEKGYIENTEPEFLADKFLSEQEMRRGFFAKDFICPGAGIQYVQLTGPWIGTSFYAQVNILINIADLVTATTGSLGFMYYF